jgi:hypothetical protein
MKPTVENPSSSYCFMLGFVAGMFTITSAVLLAELLQVIDILNLF